MNEEKVAEIPAQSLVLGGGAPVYVREQAEPKYFAEIAKFDAAQIAQPTDYGAVTRFLLELPTIASKRWVTTQYDSMVGIGNNTTNIPADAAVVNIKGTTKGIALTTDCNSRYVAMHPERGCALAVAEAARNLVCAGSIPLGVTNCLNFGNPHNPELYYQFAQAIRGMKLACEMFDTPVTGGNVSLYNQSEDGPIFPTPTIGMVGLVEDVTTDRFSMEFKKAGDTLYLIGENVEDFGASEYLYRYHKVKYSPAPYLNLQAEKNLHEAILAFRGKGILQSVHDISEGGLMVCLLESSFVNMLGFEISTDANIRKDAYLFGEAGGRIVVSVSEENTADFEAQMKNFSNVPYVAIGKVKGYSANVDGENLGEIAVLKEIYDTSLEKKLG